MICNFLFLNKYFNNDSISEVLNIARRLPGFFAVGKDNIHASATIPMRFTWRIFQGAATFAHD